MCSSSSFYGLPKEGSDEEILQGDLADMVRSITRATRLCSSDSSTKPYDDMSKDHHHHQVLLAPEDTSLSTFHDQTSCVDRVETGHFDFGSDPFSSIMMTDPLIHMPTNLLVPPAPDSLPPIIADKLQLPCREISAAGLKPTSAASFTLVGGSQDINGLINNDNRTTTGDLGGHHHPFEAVDISSCPRNPATKRRKSLAKKVVCIPAPAPANSARPTSGEVVPSDLWAWRKYGQKPIKGSPYPRGYYRCSSSKGCSARKQVERSRTDPNMLVITYTSEHNHPWPTQRNALAGSTRTHSHPSKLNTSKESSSTLVMTTSSSSSMIKEEEQIIHAAAAAHDDDHSKEDTDRYSYRPKTVTTLHVDEYNNNNNNNQQSQDDDFFAELGEIAGRDELSYLYWPSSSEEHKTTRPL